MTVGTAAYLSPEQVRGQDVGPPSDVYSLALVLLEALTGRREYSGNSVETALARLERPAQVPADLLAPLRLLLERMLRNETAGPPGRSRGGDRPARWIAVAATDPSARDREAGHDVVHSAADVPRGDAGGRAAARPAPAAGPAFAAVARGAREDRPQGGPQPRRAGVGLLLPVVLGLLAGLLAGGDGSAAKAPAPEKVPVSQLEKDLADMRKAVTP